MGFFVISATNVLYTFSVVVVFLSDKFLFRIEIVVIKKLNWNLCMSGYLHVLRNLYIDKNCVCNCRWWKNRLEQIYLILCRLYANEKKQLWFDLFNINGFGLSAAFFPLFVAKFPNAFNVRHDTQTPIQKQQPNGS